jgi:GT2 family glycosyltransferase
MLATAAVVSWNTRELLLRCLRSLASEVDAGRVQVWVVDNASGDGSAAAARAAAPWARIIETGENIGFGRAVNLVAAQTRLCLEGFWDPERARVVPWAIGACLLLRRSAFDEVGGFDARQWMYAEDLDFGWRLRQRGWLTWYEPSARVLHESGASVQKAFGDQRRTRFMAATYAMLWRTRGAARTWATAALNIAGAAGRLAWMAPLTLLSERWRRPRDENRSWLRAHLQGVRAASTLARAR